MVLLTTSASGFRERNRDLDPRFTQQHLADDWKSLSWILPSTGSRDGDSTFAAYRPFKGAPFPSFLSLTPPLACLRGSLRRYRAHNRRRHGHARLPLYKEILPLRPIAEPCPSRLWRTAWRITNVSRGKRRTIGCSPHVRLLVCGCQCSARIRASELAKWSPKYLAAEARCCTSVCHGLRPTASSSITHAPKRSHHPPVHSLQCSQISKHRPTARGQTESATIWQVRSDYDRGDMSLGPPYDYATNTQGNASKKGLLV